ncbi:PEP-CTERM sorting domain-containing protein [Aquincola sp. S2]|uniref:PEP-CTERM sorting domain-containing protein n=1 Tax=Pseudaquabacterium terrae TaxID=2732868 RepID=A0ABX2ELV1_9BURK|nr:exosortase-dependent surface protein XDP1 [Aquabacterium terrae]NRF69569.1 PEP-CTERM sorting domain-containing protein [Aquabacterium terrae]
MTFKFALKLAGLAMAALASGFAPSAHATWNFSSCTQNAGNANTYGNSFNCGGDASGVTATATAWSTTMNTAETASNVSGGSKWASANLALYSGGFGVKNQYEGLNAGSPNHSMDSYNNTTDAILLSFDSSVVLSQLGVGWYSGDSDVTVMRYTGATAPVLTGSVVDLDTLSGWELIGSHSDVGVSGTASINPDDKASSWWLISAYNNTYGGQTWSTNNDYVKLLSVSGVKCTDCGGGGSAPEPGSLALVALALVAGNTVRRRKQR